MSRALLRQLIIYAVLLVGSLAWAYQTWTHEDELALADKVVVMPGSVEQLESIVFHSPEGELTIEMREDEHGRFAWGRSVPNPEVAQAPIPDQPPDEPPPDAAAPSEFKVGRAGDGVLESLAPFVAKRRLEGADGAELDLEELGLAEPEATLEIKREGKEPKRFELGGNVFGGANVYVRDPEDGAIYLVEARVIRPLRSGARMLPDRELSGVAEPNVERVTLIVGPRQATFEQHNPDDPEAKYWSVASEEDKSPEADAFLQKLIRLRSLRYVQSDEVPVDLSSAFDFVVHPEDGEPIRVEVLRNFDDAGAEQFFARSEHTRGLVRLPRAAVAEVSADLESTLQAGGA